MRKVIFALFITLFSFTVAAQDLSSTDNRIIENGKEYYLHEVQPSEGFMSIGRLYGVPYKDILDANEDAVKDGLKLGQYILIPIVEGRNSNEEEIKSADYYYHVVDSGQTLFFISRKYEVSISDIYANNSGITEALSIGMELKIPKNKKKVIKYVNNTNTSTNTSEPETQEDDGYKYHIVKPQETAYSISRKYNISLTDLLAANKGLDSNNIPIGTKIRIVNTQITKTTPIQMRDTEYTYYRIKEDDTLEKIAEKYSISPDIILQANHLDGELSPAGYRIKIPHAYQYQVETIDKQTHTIKKKDDIREIAETYNVPIMDIQAANPQVRKWHKLKKGDELTIPTLKIETVDTIITQSSKEQSIEELSKYFETHSSEMADTLTIAFVWPLYLAHNDTLNYEYKMDPITKEMVHSERQIKSIYPSRTRDREFFFSALIALNDLKHLGIKTKVKIYDAQKGFANMAQILEDPTLAEADLIVGPIAKDHIKMTSEFCIKHKIRMILPFASKCEQLESNPYIYQIRPTAEVTNNYISRKTVAKYANSNIIVVKGKNNDTREREFITSLKKELYNPDSLLYRDISYKEVDYTRDNIGGLSALMNPEKHNLIIIPAEKEKVNTLVIPVIDNYISRHKSVEIGLVGFADWQNFKLRELENIFNIGCEIHTPFYADPYSQDPKQVEYTNSYYNYFGSYPTQIYPYYGMLGYDIISYFIKGLYLHGNDLEKNLNNIPQDGLCVDFEFERVKSWGGFVNKSMYDIELTKEFNIIVEE